NGQDDDSKKRYLPKLKADINQAVSFQQNATNNAKKMSERESFPDYLRPMRHPAKRKHEAGEQNRREKDKKCHLHRLQLVLSDGGKGDPHRQVRNNEDKRHH